MKVLLSIGYGRLHLLQSAKVLAAHSDIALRVICGWVPKRASSLPVRFCSRIVGRDLSFGMAKRKEIPENVTTCSCTSAEFVTSALFLLCRWFSLERFRMAVAGWKLFGWCSRRYIREADLFHVRSGAGQGGAIQKAKRNGMKVLVDHSIAHPDFMEQNLREEYQRNGQDFGMDSSNPFWRLVLKDCKDADILLVNSDFVKDTFIRAGYPVEKIRVVYLGVRPDFVGLKSSHECCFRRGSQAPFRLLFTGGFGFRKGAEYLLESLRILLKRRVNVVLTVVGSSEEARGLLGKYTAESANIKLVGHVPQDELKNYLAAADLYIFPSLAEGCASSAMEALAAGLCVVSTFESGLPIEDGKTGYVVPSKDAVAIADKIEWLLHHPDAVERVGCAASDLIRTQYTWERYAENVQKVYTELVSA